VANHTDYFQAAQQYLLQSTGDPALGLLIPYGGKIRITSSQTGLPCGLYPRPYEQSPTGSALALYCNATDSGAEFVYEVRALFCAGWPAVQGVACVACTAASCIAFYTTWRARVRARTAHLEHEVRDCACAGQLHHIRWPAPDGDRARPGHGHRPNRQLQQHGPSQ
jgi:hypothetical protein